MRRGLVFVARLAAAWVVVALAAGGGWFLSGQAGTDGAVFERLPLSLATPTPAQATPQQVAAAFFQAWEAGRYEEMYSLLDPESQAALSQERFVGRHQDIVAEATIRSLTITPSEARPAPSQEDPRGVDHKQVPFTVTYHTEAVGEIAEGNILSLARGDDKEWKISWSPDLVFQELAGDRLVHLFRERPVRGSIVDRRNQPLAHEGTMITVGVVPGSLRDEAGALRALSEFLGMAPETIKARYAAARPDWWVPLRDLPAERKDAARRSFDPIPGVQVRSTGARLYPNGAAAAHVVGYLTAVTAEELTGLADQGYTEDSRLGRAGIERWGEEWLAGQPGARLAIITRDGQVVRLLGERPVVSGAHIELTLDAGLQRAAEEALGERPGSIVVLDPRDNALLALASWPRFDPNAFIRGISGSEWERLNGDPNTPFLNRAALSAYPTGSVFKVITMAAGLERGGFQPTSTFTCNGHWTGLPGLTLNDWVPNGHGTLDLTQGLAQSCDIVFYEVAKQLDGVDRAALPAMARAFGLGAPTGVVGIAEAAGTVPDPDWKRQVRSQPWYTGDTVNLGIGQGALEATPLQVANAFAAIARGGTRQTPVLVRRVLDERGTPLAEFPAQEQGRLPVSAEHLAAVRQGMLQVTGSPQGTARAAFRGFPVAVAGKTGAAENQDPNSHAWFAGFAPADDPQVVVVVMLERGGFGGADAAPVARRVLEAALAR
ncbi:MAG: penicillin-binding protein 2 [Chloroflexi bacterium]|nr:penicillin-binding protein 2 [Chloroflexota bacterium]